MVTPIEVIGIVTENCSNCHQCIAVCPVKICSDGSGEYVKFNTNLCIGCGRCIEACVKSHGGVAAKSARYIIDDSPQFTADLTQHEIVALVAPSAQSNFDLPKLITALKRLGVNKVYDVSLGAEITVACYHKAIQNNEVNLPMIAQCCPAVVKYIELQHPLLINHLAPIGSPVYNLAVYVKTLHPKAELAFISPCLAKRREFQESQAVKYNVSYQSLKKILLEKDIQLDSLANGAFDNLVQASIATNFSSPGGLKEAYLHHYPDTSPSKLTRVSGPLVFNKYLLDLEAQIRQGSDYLPLIIDILGCEQGCNSGVGCINQEESIDRIEYAMTSRAEQGINDLEANEKLQAFLDEILSQADFSYNHYRDLSNKNYLQIPTETELETIYTNMHKVEEKDFRNCAACGYNSCYQMALAVYNHLNKAENCHLYQEKELRLEQQALSKMHNELSNVFDTMTDGVLVLGQDGRINRLNPAAKQIIGQPDETKILGVHVVDLFCGKAPNTLKLLETGKAFYDVEIMVDALCGQTHVTGSGIPIVNQDQEVIGATIIIRPIAQVQKLVNRFTGAQANFTFSSIIGEDKNLKRSIKLAMAAGSNMSNVLLQAESGTGKEVFAQSIHNASRRRNGPFVAINCAAMPRELVGSELFGYAEGAFTGARRGGRPGKFELANQGTLLLDEIGDMPLEQQAILLRAIQEKATMRVGGDILRPNDVRIIAATNQNLLELVEQGRFRADLYYRLNVVQIWIPPLRERVNDIKLLLEYFLNDMSPKVGKSIRGWDDEVLSCLQNYDWPGNIRQLQNVVERLLLLVEDNWITMEHLPREILMTSKYNSLRRDEVNSVAVIPKPVSNRIARKLVAIEQEKEGILDLLDRNAGNISKTAQDLGISRSTLYRKMKEYNIDN